MINAYKEKYVFFYEILNGNSMYKYNKKKLLKLKIVYCLSVQLVHAQIIKFF